MEQVGIGIVGAGVRGVYCLGQAAAAMTAETGLVITGVYDVIEQRSREAKQFLDHEYQKTGIDHQVLIYPDYRAMLEDRECSIVLVTTFTSQHRDYTIQAMRAGKKVYLDKPISVTREDAQAIVTEAAGNPLIMGFTRRYEKTWIQAKKLLDSGVIGPLQMMELNSVIPYSRYLQTWHRRKELSGGALNDKSSHHFDVFNWMADGYPDFLTAVGGRSSVFPEDEDAPASCRVCDRDCEYRRDPTRISDGAFVLQLDSWKHASDEIEMIDTCVYAPGADMCDHALVSVVYPSGVKASLFFAIFGPDTRDQETLLLVGEKGKIFLNRHEGTVILFSDYGRKQETFDCRDEAFDSSHFGADQNLIRALKAFYEGKEPVASAYDGAVSLEMVLAAQDSVNHGGQPVSCRLD